MSQGRTSGFSSLWRDMPPRGVHDGCVQIEIGPVSGASAMAWIAYGRTVLEHLARQPGSGLSENALDGFAQLLDEWDVIAFATQPFHWTSEQSAEQVEFLMKALYEIGLVVEGENAAGRMRLRPPEADEFHVLVVQQILCEIELEGPAYAHFVDGLRGEWGIARRG